MSQQLELRRWAAPIANDSGQIDASAAKTPGQHLARAV
jgi:hypothetical protein